MRIFAIRDVNDKSEKTLAVLFYYEKTKQFFIELPENADPWETPMILSSFAKRGLKRVGAYYSKLWVQQRIVPSDRQNLGHILKENGLEQYDEFELLMLAEGKCAQDDYYLTEMSKEELPADFSESFAHRIEDVIPLKKGKLLVFFQNGATKLCDIAVIWKEHPEYSVILEREDLFKKVEIQVDGNGVLWDNHITISDEILDLKGQSIPIELSDFCTFAERRLVNTAEAAEILGCSRQNIEDLVRRGKLRPVKIDTRNKLFLKSEVKGRNWE